MVGTTTATDGTTRATGSRATGGMTTAMGGTTTAKVIAPAPWVSGSAGILLDLLEIFM
jgi:hypothetical protein